MIHTIHDLKKALEQPDTKTLRVNLELLRESDSRTLSEKLKILNAAGMEAAPATQEHWSLTIALLSQVQTALNWKNEIILMMQAASELAAVTPNLNKTALIDAALKARR